SPVVSSSRRHCVPDEPVQVKSYMVDSLISSIHFVILWHSRAMRTLALCGGALLVLLVFASRPVTTATPTLPDPAVDDPLSAAPSKVSAVVAGGCFWGIEELYQHVRGVVDATSGYAGGTVKNPSYEQVSDGRTGHAES